MVVVVVAEVAVAEVMLVLAAQMIYHMKGLEFVELCCCTVAVNVAFGRKDVESSLAFSIFI